MEGDGQLARWYVDDLRPKLAGATARAAISRAQAEAFDELMLGLLRLDRPNLVPERTPRRRPGR